MSRLSGRDISTRVRLLQNEPESSDSINDSDSSLDQEFDLPIWEHLQPGQYVACNYDAKWYIAVIKEKDDDSKDVQVSFMTHSQIGTTFKWPRCVDICWIPHGHVICQVHSLVAITSGRAYALDADERKHIKTVSSLIVRKAL